MKQYPEKAGFKASEFQSFKVSKSNCSTLKPVFSGN